MEQDFYYDIWIECLKEFAENLILYDKYMNKFIRKWCRDIYCIYSKME